MVIVTRVCIYRNMIFLLIFYRGKGQTYPKQTTDMPVHSLFFSLNDLEGCVYELLFHKI